MRATRRQREIMSLVLAGDGAAGDWLDIDALIERLGASSSVASKQSVQCSLRALERHGFLLRDYRTRRGRVRMVLVPTGAAYPIFSRTGTPAAPPPGSA